MDELWGTLSIYDHRDPLFKNALLLFDRIVVPIPESPIHEQTAEELNELKKNVSLLEKHDAAIRYPWNSDEFNRWRDNISREILSIGPRDSLYDTRLMIQKTIEDYKPKGVDNYTAVPLYGSREQYNKSLDELALLPEQQLMIAISRKITVPTQDTPLEAIIKLRDKTSFQEALKSLRSWQNNVLPEIMNERGERKIRAAAQDFEKMIHGYEKAIDEAKFKKRKTWVISLIGLAGAMTAAMVPNPSAIAILASTVPTLYTFAELKQPIWKQLQDKPFSAAAIVYEANENLAKFK